MYEPGEDELHEDFTYEELPNMQRRDETDQLRSEAAWGRTRSSHPIDRASRPSIDINPPTSIDVAHTTSIDIRSKPNTICRSTPNHEHRSIGFLEHRSMTPTESTASCNAVRILNHEEFAAKHPHPPNPDNVRIARHATTTIDRQTNVDIDRQPTSSIERRAPITYRVQMPKIDVARLNALRPKPKSSDNPPETVRIPSDDGEDSMEVDRVLMGRILRKRKEKETRKKEEDSKRMFCEAREKMRTRVELKKKSDPGQFAIPCTVEPSNELFTFVDCSQRNSGGIVRDLEVKIVGAVSNLQSNQLCLTLIDPHTHYDPIPVKKSQTSSRRINDLGIIAACHCGVEYEIEYSASIETHTATSIDSGHHKSTDTPHKESVDSSPDDWENDYYNPIISAYTRQNMHTEEYDEDYEEERATERTIEPHQRNRKRASTDIANYSLIDAEVDHVQGDYSIGSWADDHHHESYAVETTMYEPGEDELHEGFTYEVLLNMQRRNETDQHRSEDAWGRTQSSHPIDRASRPSININPPTSIDVAHTTSIDIRSKPKTTIRGKNKFDNEYLTPDEFGVFRDPDGYTRAINGRILNDTKEFYDTAGGIDKSCKQRSRHPTRPSSIDVPTSVDRRPEFGRRAFDFYGTRNFYWEEKNEYGVYRDDQECARDLEGRTIRVHNIDIRRLLERASRDEPSYICLPEHASLFTQTKMVPEIDTKDKINEMFYRVCGAQEKYEGDFQMKLDGLYHPLNDNIGWLTTCMEEMSRLPTSIDQRSPASVDNSPPHSPPMKSQQDFHIREEIDQLVAEICRALDTTEERLDGRCDDIYFPMDFSISALTSKIEAIEGELVEIQSYIARRPEASASIDRRNNISTDIRRQTSVDEATNRGRLVPKVKSDMSDTHYNGEEVSDDTYATLRRHQFNLESLENRLQRMENTTATIKEKWRRGDEALRYFTGTWFNKRRE
ncbi:hypothetical protein DY000_02017153 [Brassica cretica]|uniref:Uncharacterized protein n=1 Tax=Brassica cretica TaxID=69181 RepID=A0ABQ7D8S4_BRACR|nr:hypothetical protein DY000_02017153 [Brassica cretica]